MIKKEIFQFKFSMRWMRVADTIWPHFVMKDWIDFDQNREFKSYKEIKIQKIQLINT